MNCVYCNKKSKIKTSTSSEEINNYYFKNFNFKPFESLNKIIHKYYCKSCNFFIILIDIYQEMIDIMNFYKIIGKVIITQIGKSMNMLNHILIKRRVF